MKFTKTEELARQVVLNSRTVVGIDEIWNRIGKAEKGKHWRSQACELMRRVCIKSEILPPAIERKTKLGRGNSAFYGIRE